MYNGFNSACNKATTSNYIFADHQKHGLECKESEANMKKQSKNKQQTNMKGKGEMRLNVAKHVFWQRLMLTNLFPLHLHKPQHAHSTLSLSFICHASAEKLHGGDCFWPLMESERSGSQLTQSADKAVLNDDARGEQRSRGSKGSVTGASSTNGIPSAGDLDAPPAIVPSPSSGSTSGWLRRGCHQNQ